MKPALPRLLESLVRQTETPYRACFQHVASGRQVDLPSRLKLQQRDDSIRDWCRCQDTALAGLAVKALLGQLGRPGLNQLCLCVLLQQQAVCLFLSASGRPRVQIQQLQLARLLEVCACTLLPETMPFPPLQSTRERSMSRGEHMGCLMTGTQGRNNA